MIILIYSNNGEKRKNFLKFWRNFDSINGNKTAFYRLTLFFAFDMVEKARE